MKKIFLIIVTAILLVSCTSTEQITKKDAYKGIYDEKPLTMLIMPPINRSTNVDAKEYFHSTLNIPIANSGYYVIPPFLSMEILKRESAYDAELFLNAPLEKFAEVFGADLAVFTIIHEWDKSAIGATVDVQIEYIIKSTKTNEVVFTRTGDITYDASISSGAGGIAGLVIDVTASALNTAATNYVDVARACNRYTLSDLPYGKYSPYYGTDALQNASKKVFKATINSNY